MSRVYKVMALQLMLLFGCNGLMKKAIGVLLLPLLVVIASIANLSYLSDWGDDCLGYTVTARRQS